MSAITLGLLQPQSPFLAAITFLLRRIYDRHSYEYRRMSASTAVNPSRASNEYARIVEYILAHLQH